MKRPRVFGIYEESHKIPYIYHVYSSLLLIIKNFKNNTKIHILFFFILFTLMTICIHVKKSFLPYLLVCIYRYIYNVYNVKQTKLM